MPGPQRNLIVLLAHGLRSDALEDRRSWPLPTPHFQKLADRGIRLDAVSACPADPGGMISLLTGLHPRQHGWATQTPPPARNARSQHNPPAPTKTPAHCDGWATSLRDAGFFLGGVGCVGLIEPWLHDAVPVEDVDCLQPTPSCAYLAATRQKGLTAALLQQRRQRLKVGPFDPDRLLLEPSDDIDGFITEQACRLLTKMPVDQRWALVVIFSGPGNILPPPTLYEDLVDPETLTDGFTPADLRQINDLVELDYPRSMFQRLDPQTLGRFRSDYLGRVSLIDHAVGRLMSSLQGRSDSNRTWVVLSSDHGLVMGEKGLIGHRSFLDAALHVPVIIVPSGGLSRPVSLSPDQPISTVDVAATIASIAGCDLPEAVCGKPLLSQLGDDLAPSSPACCISEFGHRLMLRTQHHKVIFDTRSLTPIQLYDRQTDPDEQTNILSAPQGPALLREMQAELGSALLPLRALPTASPDL